MYFTKPGAVVFRIVFILWIVWKWWSSRLNPSDIFQNGVYIFLIFLLVVLRMEHGSYKSGSEAMKRYSGLIFDDKGGNERQKH